MEIQLLDINDTVCYIATQIWSFFAALSLVIVLRGGGIFTPGYFIAKKTFTAPIKNQ